MKDLEEFPEFKDNWDSKKENTTERSIGQNDDMTPESRIDTAFEQLFEQLKNEILEHIMSCSPYFFERLAELMIENGVGVTPVITYDLKQIDSDYFVEE